MPLTSSGFVSVAGHKLEYQIFGYDDRTPRIVMLHEGLGCVAMWRGFPEMLARRLGEPVFAYSRYGYGRSDVLQSSRTQTFMHDEARTLDELLELTGIDRPVLLGHSDGASIALIHAGRHVGRIRAVIALAPHLFVEPISIQSIEAATRAFEMSGLREALAKYHEDPVRTFHGWADIWLEPDFAAWNIEREVADIRCPVLAIQGDQDQYGTMRQIERIAELTPDVRLHALRDCRHSPHFDQADVVLDTLEDFLRSPDRK